jgi:hypothetical protein
MLKIVVAALIAWGGWHYWDRHVAQAAVMAAPDDPIQTDVAYATPVTINGYTLTPLANFRVKARVLSTANYTEGREADLSPVDFALGWGPMSANKLLDRLSISQRSRRYYYSWQGDLQVPEKEVARHSANMHMIPMDPAVKKQLEKVGSDDIVEFEGQLVSIQASDGWHWRSSMTRDDTGDGACEVVLVKNIRVD